MAAVDVKLNQVLSAMLLGEELTYCIWASGMGVLEAGLPLTSTNTCWVPAGTSMLTAAAASKSLIGTLKTSTVEAVPVSSSVLPDSTSVPLAAVAKLAQSVLMVDKSLLTASKTKGLKLRAPVAW